MAPLSHRPGARRSPSRIGRETLRCPGCGLELPRRGLPSSERFGASAECFALYAELCGHTLSRSDPEFAHQHAVDAYAAQHAGTPTKPIGVAYALIGLCLHLEHGLNGRQVQRVHMRIPKRTWPVLAPPRPAWNLTVLDVLEASEGQLRSAIESWARSAWPAWSHEHERIRAWVSELRGPSSTARD